jgi:dethiobiotin synthetase
MSIGLTAMPALVLYECGVPSQIFYEFNSISSISFGSEIDRPVRRTNFVRAISNLPSVLQLFIAGDRSSVGKSTFSMFFLAALLDMGFPASSLAYIKPVTQCEEEQPVSIFCQANGIACCGVGPIVFYKGFTRAFLSDQTASAAEYLNDAARAVNEISVGKKVVIVDGVGYPSVGSICGLSNADVAKKLDAPVLLIGRSGVGDAIDSFNLNRR